MKFIIMVMLIALCTFSIGACNAFKVTDPSDPRFDPTKFQFSDYDGYDGLAEALKIIFEPGDSKEKIEKILVNSGQAVGRIKEPSETFGRLRDEILSKTDLIDKSHSIVFYQKKMSSTFVPNAWKVYIFYNTDKTMINIMCNRELLY